MTRLPIPNHKRGPRPSQPSEPVPPHRKYPSANPRSATVFAWAAVVNQALLEIAAPEFEQWRILFRGGFPKRPALPLFV